MRYCPIQGFCLEVFSRLSPQRHGHVKVPWRNAVSMTHILLARTNPAIWYSLSAALSFEEFEPSVGLIDVYFYGFLFGKKPFDPPCQSLERTFWKEFRVSAKQDAGAGAEDRMGWIEIAGDFFALQVGVSVADQGDHLQDKQIHGVRKD